MWINEVFGPTIQGEGSAAGRHCLFVRMADCNLHCQWCDTPYTWAFNQYQRSMLEKPAVYDKAKNRIQMSTEQVVAALHDLWPIYDKPTMVVISGGEPMIQDVELAPLCNVLNTYGHDVHIETAGTLLPKMIFDKYVMQYNVSPKLAHSGNRLALRRKPEVLRWFAANHKAWFKFVLRGLDDFDEVDELVKTMDISPRRVMVMPEGTTAEANIRVAKEIVSGAQERGFGLSFRSHVLIWGDKRGV